MLPFPRRGVRVAAVLTAVLASALTAGAAVLAPPPAPAQAQALPSPLRFVSSLDLECFPAPGQQPPITTGIVTRHLNPVLAHLPIEPTPIGAREQLCVPVAKNNMLPPPEVRRLVSFIDLKCYVEMPQVALNRTITLTQLNPVLGNIPTAAATVTFNRQLCVPVQKNNQAIPADVLNIVRWIDLEKYDIATPPLPAPVSLTLNHLNPLLAGLPAEPATITQGRQLMLPVAKNGVIPPTS